MSFTTGHCSGGLIPAFEQAREQRVDLFQLYCVSGLVCAMDVGTQNEVVVHTHICEEFARLRYEDETALDPLFEIKVAYGLAVIEQGAGRGNHSHDRFQKRRLPSPVWPDNRDDLTRLHFHRSVADGGDLSV